MRKSTHNADKALTTYGEMMKGLRHRAGLTIREAAEMAGINKNTVLRIEAGQEARRSSRHKLCAAYGIFSLEPDSMPDVILGEHFATTVPDGLRWHRAKLVDPESPSEVSYSQEMQNQAERLRQGRLRFADQFFTRLDCERSGARMKSGLFEVFGPSGFAVQRSGEAFVFMMKGAMRFVVGDEEFILGEGMAATFDRRIRHMHEPAPTVPSNELPVIMLCVQSE